MVIVAKFGGSGLRDAPSIRVAAERIVAYEEPVAIVASAIHGVTDQLTHAVNDAPGNDGMVAGLVEEVRARHLALLDACQASSDARQQLIGVCQNLERLLFGIAYTGEASPRIRDEVVSIGERLAVIVLASTIQSLGKDALPLDAHGAGIHTQGPHGNARPATDIGKAIRKHVKPTLKRGIPVITGFYGINGEGNATVFGRGGSDYVASLVADALGAKEVHLWKDVQGFLSADPKSVARAALVPELDYEEAAELAYFGAKILHPRAVEPIADAGIPIRIRCITEPDGPGTVIQQQASRASNLVRSAASRDGLAVIRISGPGLGQTPGIAHRVFEALDQASVTVLNMANSQASFALLIEEADMDNALGALQPLVGGSIRSVDALPNRSLVCVVGRGLGETPGSAALILDAVAKRDVNIEMISLGASAIAIDFVVPSNHRAQAIQGLHAAFLEADS